VSGEESNIRTHVYFYKGFSDSGDVMGDKYGSKWDLNVVYLCFLSPDVGMFVRRSLGSF
jgi:hypothetical protein